MSGWISRTAAAGAIVAVVAAAGPVGAATIFVDFGTVEPVDAKWNNVANASGVPATIADLKDDAGTDTGIDLIVANFTNANTGGTASGFAGAASETFGAGHGQDVQGDFIASAHIGEKAATLTFKQLQPNAKYTFTIFASRNPGGENHRTTVYAATPGDATASLDAGDNAENVVVLSEVAADASGEITITLERPAEPAKNNVGYTYINALRIDTAAGAAPATPRAE